MDNGDFLIPPQRQAIKWQICRKKLERDHCVIIMQQHASRGVNCFSEHTSFITLTTHMANNITSCIPGNGFGECLCFAVLYTSWFIFIGSENKKKRNYHSEEENAWDWEQKGEGKKQWKRMSQKVVNVCKEEKCGKNISRRPRRQAISSQERSSPSAILRNLRKIFCSAMNPGQIIVNSIISASASFFFVGNTEYSHKRIV